VGVVPDRLPAVIGGTESGLISIRFVPLDCITDGEEWGTVELRLDVVNAWLPSIDRTYRLPDPIVDRDHGPLSVFPPDDDPRWFDLRDPLEAACELLAAAAS